MMIGQRKKWYVRVDVYNNLHERGLLFIEIGFGFRHDAPINEIPWRHWWTRWWHLPRLIRGPNRRIIGYSICGRCRVFR